MTTHLDLQALHAETLDPVLQACVSEGPLGPMIAHPLVHCVGMIIPGLANQQLAFKRERLGEAIDQADWSSYIFLHERPYRTTALLAARDDYGIDVQTWGDLAADVWTDTENIHQHLEDWARIFRETRGADWMNGEEHGVFDGLPEQVEIWRGECNDGEVSWTTSLKVARFFANRTTHSGTGEVSHGYVLSEDVFCYLGRRSEFELIIPDRNKVTPA